MRAHFEWLFDNRGGALLATLEGRFDNSGGALLATPRGAASGSPPKRTAALVKTKAEVENRPRRHAPRLGRSLALPAAVNRGSGGASAYRGVQLK